MIEGKNWLIRMESVESSDVKIEDVIMNLQKILLYQLHLKRKALESELVTIRICSPTSRMSLSLADGCLALE